MPVIMKVLVQSGLTFKMFLLLQGLYHVTCSTSAMYIMHTESDMCKAEWCIFRLGWDHEWVDNSFMLGRLFEIQHFRVRHQLPVYPSLKSNIRTVYYRLTMSKYCVWRLLTVMYYYNCHYQCRSWPHLCVNAQVTSIFLFTVAWMHIDKICGDLDTVFWCAGGKGKCAEIQPRRGHYSIPWQCHEVRESDWTFSLCMASVWNNLLQTLCLLFQSRPQDAPV